MKSRILSLLVAMALVLSFAVPAFAQTGETSEDNNLPDVTDVTEQEETEEDLPEETEEDEDNPGEPSVSEETIDALQNNTDNIVSGSAEDNEENEQEEAGTTDPEQENDSSDGNEDDSEEESDSEVEEDVDEDDTEPDGNEDFEEDENKPEDDADHSVDGLNSEEEEDESGKEKEDEPEDGENGSETDEGAENDETEEDNASADGENNSEEDVENNSEEDDESAEIDAEDENESEEIESEESEDEEPEENADAPVEFKLLTAEELEGIDLEDAEVLEVNSVVFMAAGATKSEPLMAAPKSAPSHSGTCGENLTWTLNDEGVLTISGTGNMYEDLMGDDNPWRTIRGSITSLNIGDGVTSIGKYAFNWFDNPALNSVFIPASVISIGDYAFFSANYITTFQFGHSADSDLTIGTGAFQYNLGHNEAAHLVDTTVKVPDANNINPAISGYDWKTSYRNVTFKSAPSGDSGNSSNSGSAGNAENTGTNTSSNENTEVSDSLDSQQQQIDYMQLNINEEKTGKPEIKVAFNSSVFTNSGNSTINMNVATTFADWFYLELLDDVGNPIVFYDEWAGEVTQRVYNYGDFAQEGTLYTLESHSWGQISIIIPANTPVGEYTLRVVPVNNEFGDSSEPYEKKITIIEDPFNSASNKKDMSLKEAKDMISTKESLLWGEENKGTIRYIQQGNWGSYYKDYWPTGNEEHMCDVSSACMGLSYIGINKLPKDVLDNAQYRNSSRIESIGQTANCSVSKFKSAEDFVNAYNNYAESEDHNYSPIMIFTGWGNGGTGYHSFTVYGRDAEDSSIFYAIDPGSGGDYRYKSVKFVDTEKGLMIQDVYVAGTNNRISYYGTQYPVVYYYQYSINGK